MGNAEVRWECLIVQEILAWLEKQKEQKPNIEICPHSIKGKSYSETGYPIEDCDYGLEIALNILQKTYGKVEGYQTDDGIREHETAIQAVKDAMKEQKPAEWSDDDKHRLSDAIYFLESTKPHYADTSEIEKTISWLKSLHPQLKQEWSEEDERMRKAVLDEIEHQIEIMPDADDMDSDDQDRYNELISMSVWMEDFPKCMKPHWKPSKEQTEIDLASEIEAASKRYPEVSYAKLSRIAKRFYELGQCNARKEENK